MLISDYKGYATDWVGFEFNHEGKHWKVMKQTTFRNYEVTSGNNTATATQYDLMHEYILQLRAQLADRDEYIDSLHKQLSINGD